MSEAVPIRCTVNGRPTALTVDPNASAARVVRTTLGLTGTKVVCGGGSCGACTVLLDGTPVVSCLLPATALDGRSVDTVERWGAPDIHPVQRALLVHDGLQCGYCTPGFVVEAVAFFEAWRDAHGPSVPPRESVERALSGHLCRCGAYVGIVAAVRAACAGDFDGDAVPRHPRHDGMEKVTGAAVYTTDVRLEGMLTAAILGSSHAHARVVRVDLSAAAAMDGVRAVLDVLDDPHRVVRYVGQPVVAVAAVDRDTAHRALAAVVVEVEPRPFVLDLVDAAQPDAPRVYPEEHKAPPNASEGPVPPGRWRGNVRHPWLNVGFSKQGGRVKRVLRRARAGTAGLHLVEGVFTAPAQLHTAFEPHACVARWAGDRLEVWTSTQTVHLLGREIAARYGLDADAVEVHAEFVGGAFGAKQGLRFEHTIAIDLARRAGAPVRLVLDRAEELNLGGARPTARIEIAVVTDDDLRPLGIQALAWGGCGVAVQSQNAPWIRFTYDGPKRCKDFDVVTNAPPARPFRAPSGPSAFFALESAMDQLAHQRGVDPVALRRAWDDSAVRPALYDWVESIPEWRNRSATAAGRGRVRSGIGLAIGGWLTTFHKDTTVRVRADVEGVVATCAVQDMGQGARSVLAGAVAGELGLRPEDVRVELGRSSYPEGPISSASRTTASVHPAAAEAARGLRARLEAAARAAGLAGARWGEGKLHHEKGRLGLAELVSLTGPVAAEATRGGNSPLDLLGQLPSGDLGINPFLRMTGAISVVAADVDTRLGRIVPRKVWMGVAAGRIVQPALARSQVYGAVIQGLGYALTEERQVDPNTGTLLSANLDDYRIPGIGDVPEIEVHFHEEGFEGMRDAVAGLAELVTTPTPAALANAVFHATGWRPRELPMRPHRVLENLS